jgi:hypothetical protein
LSICMSNYQDECNFILKIKSSALREPLWELALSAECANNPIKPNLSHFIYFVKCGAWDEGFGTNSIQPVWPVPPAQQLVFKHRSDRCEEPVWSMPPSS